MTHRVNHILRNSHYGVKYSCTKRQLKSMPIQAIRIANNTKQGAFTNMQLIIGKKNSTILFKKTQAFI